MPRKQERPFEKLLSKEEKDYIKEYWHEYTLDQLAYKLDVHPESARFIRRQAELRTEVTRWTVQELDFLKRNCDLEMDKLCQVLKRHTKAAIKIKKNLIKKKIKDDNEKLQEGKGDKKPR